MAAYRGAVHVIESDIGVYLWVAVLTMALTLAMIHIHGEATELILDDFVVRLWLWYRYLLERSTRFSSKVFEYSINTYVHKRYILKCNIAESLESLHVSGIVREKCKISRHFHPCTKKGQKNYQILLCIGNFNFELMFQLLFGKRFDSSRYFQTFPTLPRWC